MTATFISATNDPASGDSQVASRSTQKPAGAQLAIVWVQSWTGAGGGTITPSGGSGTWTARSDTTTGAARTAVFLKYVDADSTGTTYTFTFGGGSTWCALKAHYIADVDGGLDLTTVPFDLATAGGTGYASVSVTAAAGAFLSWSGNAAESSDLTHTPPTDYTETADLSWSTAAYRIATSGGTQTASGAAASGSVDNKQAALLAIAPVDAGGAAVLMPRAVIVAG